MHLRALASRNGSNSSGSGAGSARHCTAHQGEAQTVGASISHTRQQALQVRDDCCIAMLFEQYTWLDYARGKDLARFLRSHPELMEPLVRVVGAGEAVIGKTCHKCMR